MTAEPDHPKVWGPGPLLLVGLLAAGLLTDRLTGWSTPLEPGVRLILAAVIFGLGAATGLWALAALKRVGTHVLPSKPTTALALEGPYVWSRNPGYVGQLLMYLGLALAFDSLTAVALTVVGALILHHGLILPEEAYLRTKFGAAYEVFSSQVRRWI